MFFLFLNCFKSKSKSDGCYDEWINIKQEFSNKEIIKEIINAKSKVEKGELQESLKRRLG